jgi:hypothetical protein
MVYDEQRGVCVLFGGFDGNGRPTDTWQWDGRYLGTASTFGTGCGSPLLDLAAAGRPIIGETAHATLTNVPSQVAFVALGWSRTTAGAFSLPLSLAFFGMPGCDLLQSAEVAADPANIMTTGIADYALPIPNFAGLIGLVVHLQGWAVAPGMNAGNTIVSNGLTWGIGAF